MRILPQFAGGSSAGNEARVAKSLRAENIAQENINHRLTLYTPNKTDTKKNDKRLFGSPLLHGESEGYFEK